MIPMLWNHAPSGKRSALKQSPLPLLINTANHIPGGSIIILSAEAHSGKENTLMKGAVTNVVIEVASSNLDFSR